MFCFPNSDHFEPLDTSSNSNQSIFTIDSRIEKARIYSYKTPLRLIANFGFGIVGKRKLENFKMGTELEFVIMVIAVSCVKLLSAHNSTQHTSRKHKV
jgi:hypothetical protein